MLYYNLNINYLYFSSDDDDEIVEKTFSEPPKKPETLKKKKKRGRKKKIVTEDQVKLEEPVIGKFATQLDHKYTPHEYEVDTILEKREKLSGIEYLVHWKGYSCDHDSWEPKQFLHCDKILKEFEKCWELDLEKYKALMSKKEEKKITKLNKKNVKPFYNLSNYQNDLPSTSYDLPSTSHDKHNSSSLIHHCYCEKHCSTEYYSESD